MDSNKFRTVRGYQLLQKNKKLLTSAMEDYLEMIYRNSLEEGYLRINRLAELLNVAASSASKMAQKLGTLGLLKYERYGFILLTENGKIIGEYLLERHKTVEKFLRILDCGDDVLARTELIEHNIDSNTMEKIKILNSFFENNEDIYEEFKEFKSNYVN